MDDRNLRDILERLRKEIENIGNLDETGKQLAGKIVEDIDALLNREGNIVSAPRSSITQRLEETVSHIEESHPELALTLSEFLNILSNAGI